MIVTVFLFLLGTKTYEISAVNADVSCEPSKITIKEQINQSPSVIPKSGPPNFVHQGSNYFFGSPSISRPSAYLSRPDRTDVIEKLPRTNPLTQVNGKERIRYPKLSLTLPNVALNMQSDPLSVPFINYSELLSQLPSPFLNIPSLSFFSRPPYLSTQKEKPVRLSNEVLVKKIPPPPQLPPLKLEDIFPPFIVEEKKVILVPSAPEIEAVLPAPLVLASQPCIPTMCARNIVFERVLPNIAKKSKKVKLISIPDLGMSLNCNQTHRKTGNSVFLVNGGEHSAIPKPPAKRGDYGNTLLLRGRPSSSSGHFMADDEYPPASQSYPIVATSFLPHIINY